MDAMEAAKKFISENYPDCRVAILAGSVVRGEETDQSDLDIVIIDDSIISPYRESVIAYQWMIETFVNTSESYRDFFEKDSKRGRPSLPQMCVEGIVFQDDGLAKRIKVEAEKLLMQGPEPWTRKDIDVKRYMITDLLFDLEGSTNEKEDLFIVSSLSIEVHEFILRTNRQWVGNSKWIVRALRNYSPELCEEFVKVYASFYKNGDKQSFIEFVDRMLKPYGGRLFQGFSIGK
ncbi:nucleotidyltransferase domain-containing protein [Shimazuella sp. AN120528]|nr:nucleotidyltransferase domain-containing protein [Shimazuella soli]MCH5586362.1 nucleotidyltransferase domain-containing protein [Shimazuella soli]